MPITLRRATVAAAGAVALVAFAAPAGAAAAPTSTLYVSPTGTSGNDGTSCAQATYSSVQAAVTASSAGGTVVVCAGRYVESVTVPVPLTLIGQGAVIDATGQPYGIGLAASYSTVTGFTVENAHADQTTQTPGDGIVTGGLGASGVTTSSNDVITGNTTLHNDGSGIDVQSSSYSVISDNVSRHNGIGINVSNDFGGPSAHNRISGNVASNNPGGCGIVLADHSGSGVFDNQVFGNTARNNGLGSPSAPKASSGSGIILAVGGPHGGAYDNLVQGNTFTGNGHGGVAVHGHGPGLNFTGNRIIGNTIGRNNLRTDYKDMKSTGIYLGDVSPLTITVKHNLFMHDHYGVFTAGPVTVKGMKSNGFLHVKKHRKHIKKYAG